MDREGRIERIVAPALEAMGLEVVRVMIMGDRTPVLQVMVERQDRGILTVEHCAKASRTISALLDVDDPIDAAYTLEVSSPGIDRPLTRLADFDRFAGFEAKVETTAAVDGRRRFRGRLHGLEGEAVKLEMDGDGAAPVTVLVPFREIRRAKLVLTDDLIAAAQQG